MAVEWKKILTEVDIIDEDNMASNLDTKVPTQQSVKAYVDSLCILTGVITLANTRLSLVNGTAFFDFGVASLMTSLLGCKLTITDSAGKKAIGYIKAAGSGETYGSNISNADFADGSNWTMSGAGAANWVIAGGAATWTGGGGSGYLQDNSITPVVGGCFVQGYKLNSITGGANHQASMGGVGMAYTAVAGTFSKYFTATGTTKFKIYAADAQTSLEVDDIVGKQVLTPSATGVTIVSTAGGTTYNWASIESGFKYNDTSGYTYYISPTSITIT